MLTLSRVHGDCINYSVATDVPFLACVVNLPCVFTYYLDFSIFIL